MSSLQGFCLRSRRDRKRLGNKADVSLQASSPGRSGSLLPFLPTTSVPQRVSSQARLMQRPSSGKRGWGDTYVVCVNFSILRIKPCPCWYLTHLHVCRRFILSFVTVSKPCRLSELYPNIACIQALYSQVRWTWHFVQSTRRASNKSEGRKDLHSSRIRFTWLIKHTLCRLTLTGPRCRFDKLCAQWKKLIEMKKSMVKIMQLATLNPPHPIFPVECSNYVSFLINVFLNHTVYVTKRYIIT